MAADMSENGVWPPLTPEDLQAMAAEGLLPPEFWRGPEITEMGRESAKILKTDFDLAANAPESPQDEINARGPLGDTFRTVVATNLGRGVPLSAGEVRVPILEARGLNCLNPVGIILGYDVSYAGPSDPLEVDPTSPIATQDIFLRATIEIGVGGATQHIKVDVGRGTQIRVPAASFVRVYYDYEPDDSTTPPRTGPDIVGIALLGYGTPSFRPSPARFTQRVASVAPTGTSSVIEIPKFAQSYGVVGEKASIAGWSATLLPAVANDGNGHSVFQPLTDGMMESQLFIPNAMTAIQLTNGSATAQPVNIVFSIML
jgi:hypothetical protein